MRPHALPHGGMVALWVAAVTLVCVGQWQLVEPSSLLAAVVIWVGGLAVFVWLQWPTLGEAPPVLEPVAVLPRWRWMLAAVAAAAGVALWVRARGRPADATWTDVTALWMISMTAMVASTWRRRSAVKRRVLATRTEAAVVTVVVIIGAAARFIALDRFPMVDGDGMALSLAARDATTGELTNPFSIGWSGNPTLYAFMQSAVMRVLGESLFSARFLSALIGSLTVLATYCWCHRMLGPRVALIASALLAVLPIHVYFSRNSLNLVEDALFLVLVLWLLDRAVTQGRRLDAALAGLALGLSQYFYFGARLLPMIVVLLLAWFVLWCRRRGLGWAAALRRIGATGGWVFATALLVFLPLAAHYADVPSDFNSRFRQVAFFGPALDAVRAQTGSSTVELVAEQAIEAALLPFHTVSASVHWHPSAPLIGLPIALVAALGIAVATAASARRRYVAIAVGWWVTLAGIFFTQGLSIQRWTLAYPLIAVTAAIGIDAAWRILGARVLVPARAAAAVCVSIVVALMLWSVLSFFRDENTLVTWGDGNSLVADRLAQALADEPDGTLVYTVFAPRMTFVSHPTVPFLAGHVTGVDVLEPMTGTADVPPSSGRTLFAFLPERLGELDVVRAVHPGGTVAEVRYRGGLLFVTYALEAPA